MGMLVIGGAATAALLWLMIDPFRRPERWRLLAANRTRHRMLRGIWIAVALAVAVGLVVSPSAEGIAVPILLGVALSYPTVLWIGRKD
jgi:hypothetical protein